ncbi:MAG TPA: hypothetical protein VEX38_02080 [Fimbriimonadaceae bacterium]|nr:hypothetical protein [Fimbriimonadaceae bacterium]
MLYASSSHQESDPKFTERVLLNQPDVLDASVWFSSGRMMAHVTVQEGTSPSKKSLQEACKEALGIAGMPNEIIFIKGRRRVQTA